MKYIITGSTGADFRSFYPKFIKHNGYDTLAQTTQAAIDLINHDLTEFGDDFHLKTGNLSWEILDSNSNSWERIQIKEANDYEKKNTKKVQSLNDFDNYMILKDYLESICEALLNNEHQKVNRLLNTTTEQFAAKNKQTQLQEEFTNFCEFAADELDDDMSGYFFNENLPRYVKEWQKEKLIEL